jgi:hypothetical protein
MTNPGPPVTRAEFDELRGLVERLAGRAAEAVDKTPDGGGSLWALHGLQQRTDDPAGAVLLTGSVELQPGAQYLWQEGATTSSLLTSDWSELVPALDALAHPVRLQLLQLVLNGTDRTADLGEADGLGTSGQLHHHLRQLVAAGWLRSAGRGRYEIPGPRVVPLLVVLTAVAR